MSHSKQQKEIALNVYKQTGSVSETVRMNIPVRQSRHSGYASTASPEQRTAEF